MDWFGKLLGRDKKTEEDKQDNDSGVSPAVIRVKKREKPRPASTAAPPKEEPQEKEVPAEEPVEEEPPAAPEEPAPPPPPQIEGKDHKVMMYVPAGKFIMGSEEAADSGNSEHEAETRAFYIDKYPVTNAEYKAFLDKHPDIAPPDYWNGANYPDGKAEHPVVRVNWHQAVAYAKWADKRLPKEAEWEKAARGTDGRRFPWGDKFDARKCNTHESGTLDTTPVGKYSPDGDSPYEVGDMAGNVWEWVQDWYDENKRYRAMRGGSWHFFENHSTCSARSYDKPTSRSDNYGFRCCQNA